jgi:alpha-amylase
MTQLRLVLALHNHQPVGNFDGVFEAAAADSYRPFLEVLDDYPELPVNLHTSGSLLEWLVEHDPEYINHLRKFVERGQIEILGGPFFEPILPCIPRRDRIGQIRAYSRFLEQTFGCTVRGMWVPERVWEQTFTGDITDAGIEYLIVDDSHFRGAGLAEDRLYGYYLTEDEGRLLKIFPGSERLRYTIPFQDPQQTIEYLRHIAQTHPSPVVAFGDDGEKFGTWPGTKKHVYHDGWLRRFLDTLMKNRDWLKVATLSDAVDNVAPLGRVYLPDSSYREMMEWALPTQQQITYHRLVHAHEHDQDWDQFKQFVRAGFWRNFLVKYPESNEMYCRMREVSDRLERLEQSDIRRDQPELWRRALTELYRGQCNCPYWHGAFGGLYLPHLRNAIYKHLIAADSAIEALSGREGKWIHVEAEDFNLDARKEVRVSSDRLIAYLAPARGGHLYEFDLRGPQVNLLATLNRRPEPYHQKVRDHAAHQQNGEHSGAMSIHDRVHFKQPNLDQKLTYDRWPRKSLVDHFLRPGLTLEEFERCEGEIGDFLIGVYETRLRRSDSRVEVMMRRDGRVGEQPVTVIKSVSLDTAAGGLLEIDYKLQQLPVGRPLHFAVEFNFAGMAAGADDRYFYGPSGEQLGQLQTAQSLRDSDRIGLVDEWLGVDVSLDLSQPGGIWTLPIQTVSQSEGGFELVHQSAAVIPHWELVPDAGGRWSVTIKLTVDSSACRARELAAAAV